MGMFSVSKKSFEGLNDGDEEIGADTWVDRTRRIKELDAADLAAAAAGVDLLPVGIFGDLAITEEERIARDKRNEESGRELAAKLAELDAEALADAVAPELSDSERKELVEKTEELLSSSDGLNGIIFA